MILLLSTEVGKVEDQKLNKEKAKAFDLIVQRERIRAQERTLSQEITRQMLIIKEMEEKLEKPVEGKTNGTTAEGC